MGNTSSKEYPDINSFAHYIHTDSRKPLDFDSPAAHRNILLPKYYNTEHIPTLRLVLAEPALPLVDSFRKARLILFETARLNKPRYAVLESKETVALLGDAREVDLQLVRFERHIDGEKLYFGPEKKKAEKLLEELNTKVMENSAMVCAVGESIRIPLEDARILTAFQMELKQPSSASTVPSKTRPSCLSSGL